MKKPPVSSATDRLSSAELAAEVADALRLAAAHDDNPAHHLAVRERLRLRAEHSVLAEAPMFSARRRHVPIEMSAGGGRWQTLYAAKAATLRPGEPWSARVVMLTPGEVVALLPAQPPSGGLSGENTPSVRSHGVVLRELLVLSGEVQWMPTSDVTQPMKVCDYHLAPASDTSAILAAGPAGACVFVREAPAPECSGPSEAPMHAWVPHAEAAWQDYAPRIQRCVLWQCEGLAAQLYRAQAGAWVPQHWHRHDEECLMVQGDVFLDDCLLCEGDYQLAPAGTGHRITATDGGALIYAHGDLEMDIVPPPRFECQFDTF